MTTINKINYLNEICNNTLTFTSYSDSWQVCSYGDNTLLNMSSKYPYLTSYHFDELVDEAYEYVINKQKETVNDEEAK